MNAHSRKESRRILALWFSHLATDRIRRRGLGASWRSRPLPANTPPLVVHRSEKNARRVAALDEQAEALGLKRGMGLADARAMFPAVEPVEADPAADRRTLDSLADWCDRYTPLVAVEGADGLFLDITGCAHLFGGEKPMMDDLLARLFAQGFAVRAGLASTPGAAWAAARFPGPAAIAPGGEAGALSPLPLAALRLDPEICESLASLGLRTAGAVMTMPRAPLARRFGKTLATRLDQALGRVEETISPRLPVPPLSVERRLAEAVALTDDIEGLTGMLAASLARDLERRGEGAEALQLALFRVDGAVSRLVVRASLPLREPAVIQRLFRERLGAAGEQIESGCGFDLVRLSVLHASPVAQEQTDFSGGATDGEKSLALFADRVRARLGERALARPVAAESHIPERAARLAPFAEACKANRTAQEARQAAQPTPRAAPDRPVRLFSPPEPVEIVAAEVPEGPPLRFRWRRALHRVTRSEGPERIAPEWWCAPDDAPTRDYFRLEDAQGRRYWLFRQGFYGTAGDMPRWFMHGVFA